MVVFVIVIFYLLGLEFSCVVSIVKSGLNGVLLVLIRCVIVLCIILLVWESLLLISFVIWVILLWMLVVNCGLFRLIVGIMFVVVGMCIILICV